MEPLCYHQYLHRGGSTSGTSTGARASPLPALGAESLRYLHKERSISGISDTCTGAGQTRAERPRGMAGPAQGKAEPPFPRGWRGRSPAEAGGRRALFQPHRRKMAPELGACFKSQIAPGAGARPPPREQCAAPGPPPPAIARPWISERGGGKPNQILPSSNIWGPSPRRGPGAAGKAEKTRVEIIRSDLFPWSDSSFEQLPNGSFCLSESFSSRFCSD